MMLPEAYIVQKFYQFAGRPKYNRLTKTYQGGCPICREGKSWGRKRRLFYIVKDNYFHCHNCGWHSNPINWIIEVSNDSYEDLMEESKEFDILPEDLNKTKINDTVSKILEQRLPEDSINLYDDSQVSYYKSNNTIKLAIQYIKNRKLDIAINKPIGVYISLKDKIHKNRLILPFYDTNNKIIHYQTRTLLARDNFYKPKYLSKIKSEKSVFNINQVTEKTDRIYIFEGPIDACFVENGVAVAGITENSSSLFTKLQSEQLNKFPFHKKIIVLDSQWKDTTSLNKTKILLDAGYEVFLWPKKLGTLYKDLNDVVMALKTNRMPSTFIDEHSYKGLKGRVILSQIN